MRDQIWSISGDQIWFKDGFKNGILYMCVDAQGGATQHGLCTMSETTTLQHLGAMVAESLSTEQLVQFVATVAIFS